MFVDHTASLIKVKRLTLVDIYSLQLIAINQEFVFSNKLVTLVAH